ncbi:COX15/CtaA family protein [Pinisolibacter sp.]|uniref:COX15/CtaA family protein n=1 Tax=Pinisolibacter sp. TaxID=2172024 RepID=UPI002FDCF8F3
MAIGTFGGEDGSGGARSDERSAPLVRTWLFVVAAMIFAMVVVGGATRLTGSGLSITEWAPIMGAIPPLSEADWAAAFAKYKEIPQYRLENAGMSLGDFKSIFWWEWSHRLLGRSIGVVYALPLLWFVVTGRIGRARLPRFLLLLVLGGLQGFVGWWMVASGLVDRVTVAPYRLAVHLTLAAVIFAAIVWTALTCGPSSMTRRRSPILRVGAGAVLGWTVFQIFLGALVAGNHAGLVYNTWPSMNGYFAPPDLMTWEPWWRNFFENHAMVQFLHRMGAYVLFALAIAQFTLVVVTARTSAARVSAFVLGFAVAFQMLVGIATLLTLVPLSLALTHQAVAMVVLTAAVVHAVSVFAPGHIATGLPEVGGRAPAG